MLTHSFRQAGEQCTLLAVKADLHLLREYRVKVSDYRIVTVKRLDGDFNRIADIARGDEVITGDYLCLNGQRPELLSL